MADKMTKKDKLIAIRDYIAKQETENKDLFLETLDHEIELLEKKNSKPSKEDEITIGFRNLILQILQNSEGSRASDFLSNSDLLAFAENNDFPLRIQRITAALSKLSDGENAPVKREVVKKVAYFKINEGYIAPNEE